MSKATESADAIRRLLKEDAVQDVLADLKDQAYRQFLAAKNDDERRSSHANAQAVDRLETAFQAVVDAGDRERMEAEIAERRPSTR